MTQEGMSVIQNLPREWQGLFKAFMSPDNFIAAELWLQDAVHSRYGNHPVWQDLLSALGSQHPMVEKDELTFVPKFLLLPEFLQKDFLTLLLSHRDDLPPQAVDHFLDAVTSSTPSKQSWITNLLWQLRDKSESSKNNNHYPFTDTMQALSRDLLSQLRSRSGSTVWHCHHSPLQRLGIITDMEQMDTNDLQDSEDNAANFDLGMDSDVVELSDEVAEIQYIDDKDKEQSIPYDVTSIPPADVTSIPPADVMKQPSDICIDLTDTSASVPVDVMDPASSPAVVMDMSVPLDTLDVTSSSSPLTADLKSQLLRLRDSWCSNTDNLVAEQIAAFTTFNQREMEEACTLLDLSTLSEVAMAIACQQIASIKDELSLGNGVIFAKTCILPKFADLTQSASRVLASNVAGFASVLPKQSIDGVIIPCMASERFGAPQADLTCRLIKETFTVTHQAYLLQQIIQESCCDQATVMDVVQRILDSPLILDERLLSELLISLEKSSQVMCNSLKFGKVVLALLNKYGKQMSSSHKGTIAAILVHHKTFLKKSAEAGLKRLKS